MGSKDGIDGVQGWWKDIQNNLGITGCGFSMIFNLGTASANGFDLGLQALVGDHVRLDANVGRTNARYTSTISGLVTAGEQVLEGAELITLE